MSGQRSSPEVTARAGETVTLPSPVTATVKFLNWYRGTIATYSGKILVYHPSTPRQTNGPQYTGREKALPDGSLQIKDVRTSDTGEYMGFVNDENGIEHRRTTQLRVYGTEHSPDTPATPATSSAGTEPALATPATPATSSAGPDHSPATPDTTCSCWQSSLGLALGVLLSAAFIIAVVILHYKRLLGQNCAQNDEINCKYTNTIQNSETHLENTRKRNIRQPANEARRADFTYVNETPGADSTYTELEYGDQTMYKQLNRR
ncbi:carcinoembryonic antigen-related cell adhesion molecule 8-like [Ambystoma mexicanum]|uniref:carcinoembryonic antigen-related cell adhesion molecule 8-like n=1 Tax=Ambystoma mexicanum TaxID=8296 RepID=UPI0037E7C472